MTDSNTPPQADNNNEGLSNPRRVHYDYSRSTSSNPNAGGHWYSFPGGANPLEGQKPAPQIPYTGMNQPSPVAPTRRPPTQPTSQARERLNQRRASRRRVQQNWAWVIVAVALLGMTLITSMILLFVLKSDNDDNVFAGTANTPEPTSSICNDPNFVNDPNYTDVCGSGGDGTAVGGALDGNAMHIEPWDGENRLTILVMGMDNRPDEQDTVICRTDTIMLISIDPATETIGILSIPRDTYVEVPNYGLQRINTACVLGNLEKPGYGPVLAMQTVQYNFGIRVNEYMMVNFNAFISLIDRVGGVDINNVTEIDDPQYPSMDYGYDPFYLPVGQHHLDGATALKYARSRHNSDDVDRQRRQQEIISAVRQRVLALNMLDNLIIEAPGLWRDVDAGVDTSLDLQEDIIPLVLYAKDIPEENIHKGIVSWEYLFSYQTPGGASVLVPKRSVLGGLMIEVFGENYSE